jgi:hypothetical protein
LKVALRIAALLPFAAALVLTGCASLNAAQTANTMGKGGLQLGLEPAAYGISGTNGAGSTTFPRVDLAVRYGVTDNVDIGGKLGSSLFEINAKFQVTDAKDKGFVVSIAPSLGGFVIGGGNSDSSSTVGSFTIKVPVLLGFGFGDGNQFVLGPNIQNILVAEGNSGSGSSGGSAVADIVGLGLSAGMVFKIGDGFRLMPEVGIMVPIVGVAGDSSGQSSANVGTAGFLYQIGLTFLFGSYQGAQR